MLELNNRQTPNRHPVAVAGPGSFNPCTRGGSLLKVLARAADCNPDRNKVRPRSLVRASPFFVTARKTARVIMPERNQLVGVYAVVAPTRAAIFDRMVRHSDKQQQNLPRRFLRENSGASKPNTLLKPKGREPRQANE
jgi:hypothetical protein